MRGYGNDDDDGVQYFCEEGGSGVPDPLLKLGGEMPNAVTRKAIEDAENGIGMSRAFSSVKELMEDLNADD